MTRTCSIPDCIRPPSARDLCTMHYQRRRGNDRLDATERFAQALKAAMVRRGVTCKQVAEAVGVQPESISHLRNADNRPSHPTAVALAEFLNDDTLANISAEMHTRTCAIDGRPFITKSDSSTGGRYCSRRCLTTAQVRRNRESRGNDLSLQARRWRESSKAIAVFCGQCEPVSRICQDGTCPLRPFSPFKLAVRKVA